jgi:hypothetical protein
MKVTLHLNLKSCNDCPYKKWSEYSGRHYCGHPTVCGIMNCYDDDFPKYCPFLQQKEEEEEAVKNNEDPNKCPY